MIDASVLLTAASAGLIVGMLVGLLPGLGIGSATLLMLPFLSLMPPMAALFFFVTMLVVSQYFGSITALVYGVPGELSSYPVINERANLLGNINQVLYQTAVGSLVGGSLALLLLLALIWAGNIWLAFFHYKVMAVVMLLACLATVFFGSQTNGRVLNAGMFVVGYLLSKIGFDSNLGESWGTLGISALASGIPLIPLAFGLVVIPAMVTSWQQGHMAQIVYTARARMQHWSSVARGSVLGVIGGLVPGVTYLAGTQLAYMIERWVHAGQSSAQRVIATSTADNAGATSSLYTLLWLGIPISVGEAVIVHLFERKNQLLSWEVLQAPISLTQESWSIFGLLLAVFVMANVVAFALSWPARRLSVNLVKRLLHPSAKYVILTLMAVSLAFAAMDAYNAMVFLVTLLICTIVGIMLKHKDWIPLIIGFVLEPNITMVLYKIGILTF
jgi:putative tricarboxylic transport membrane protein